MDVDELRQQAEQLLDQLLELASAVEDISNPQDAGAKREQLRAICVSVRQLERRNVAVPDDLRRIKTDLTSSLAVVEEAEQIKELLRKQLLDLLELLGGSSNRRRRRRTPGRGRVTLADLMEAGVLEDGVKIVHRAKRSGENFFAQIRKPGVVEINEDGTKQIFSNPSAAGKFFAGRNADGWRYWSVIEDNGDEVPLKVYRSRFLKKAKI